MSRTRVADILTIASYLSAIPAAEIAGQSRRKHLVRIRFAVATIAKEQGHSYPAIGRVLGNRDHSSIINAVDKAEIYAERDPALRAMINRLRDLSAHAKPFVADRIGA